MINDKKIVIIISFIVLLLFSILMPASFKLKEHFNQLRIEEQQKLALQLEAQEKEREISETYVIMNQIADKIVVNLDENNNLIKEVDVKIKDFWGNDFNIEFLSEKEVKLTSLGADKIKSTDDLLLTRKVEEKKDGLFKSLIKKIR